MKQFSRFFTLFLLLTSGLSLSAQNGNLIISGVSVEAVNDYSAIVEIRLSGNLAADYCSADIHVTGEALLGGAQSSAMYADSRMTGTTGAVVLTGAVTLNPNRDYGDDWLEIEVIANNCRTGHIRQLSGKSAKIKERR